MDRIGTGRENEPCVPQLKREEGRRGRRTLGAFAVSSHKTLSAFRTLTFAFLLGQQLVLSQASAPIGDDLTDPQAKPVDTSPCIQPAPLFSAADYQGPLKKIVFISRTSQK